MKNTLLLAFLVVALASCQRKELVIRDDSNELPASYAEFEAHLNLPPVAADFERSLPDYLKKVGLQVTPTNNEKATIGRVLFYDKNLSLDRTISCASCHKQNRAFSDTKPVSTGINGLAGTRNAMPLANVASFSAHYNPISGIAPLLLWDNRASSIAEQSTLAFINDHEMGMTLEGVVNRIKEQPYYPYLWNQTYGNFDVNSDQVLECLTQFVGAIGAQKSRFDVALEAVNGNINFDTTITIHDIYSGGGSSFVSGLPGFSTSETHGRDVFIANCSKCHSPIRPFQEVMEACNGLDMTYNDKGKAKLTGKSSDEGVFKAPSLRNIQLTAPYMHDGRFATLEQVVDFYSTGIQPNPNLHPSLLHNGSTHMNLTELEKQELISFLGTLTDYRITTDDRFSDPFKY